MSMWMSRFLNMGLNSMWYNCRGLVQRLQTNGVSEHHMSHCHTCNTCFFEVMWLFQLPNGVKGKIEWLSLRKDKIKSTSSWRYFTQHNFTCLALQCFIFFVFCFILTYCNINHTGNIRKCFYNLECKYYLNICTFKCSVMCKMLLKQIRWCVILYLREKELHGNL